MGRGVRGGKKRKSDDRRAVEKYFEAAHGGNSNKERF
jgi:hypothetical protein